MSLDDRLALELGRALLRAVAAESRLEQHAAEIAAIRRDLDQLTADAKEKTDEPA